MSFKLSCSNQEDLTSLFSKLDKKQYDEEKLKQMQVDCIKTIAPNIYLYKMSPMFYHGWLALVLSTIDPYLEIQNETMFDIDQKRIDVILTGVHFEFQCFFRICFDNGLIEIDRNSIKIPKKYKIFKTIFIKYFVPRLVQVIHKEICG